MWKENTMNRPDFYHTRDLIIGWPSKESLDKKDDSVDANTSTSEEWINKYNKNYKQIKNK